MKPIPTLILLASLFSAASTLAAEPVARPDANPAPSAEATPAPVSTVSASPSVVAPAPAQPAEPGTNSAAASTEPNDTNTVRMNFHAASLDIVLNYLAEAAGFVINVKPGTSVRGKVDVWSNNPMTREEALNLVDTVLNQNGLAAIRNGRTLTIVNRDEAKTQNIPVIQGSDPEKIPATDKIVTQIMPVRFVEAAQLVKDLQPLVSSLTTMTANEAGNSIVMTDTQANIRKVAEIIHAIDSGAEDFTEVRVFRLKNADPNETADLLSTLFPDESKSGSGNTQSPFAALAGRFGGGGGGRFGGFGGLGGGGGGGTGGGTSGGSNNQNQRIKKRNRVIAVADQRTASIVVSATRDLMDQIDVVITGLDADSKGRKSVQVFRLENANPQEALPVLQDIFQKNTTQNSRNSAASQNNPLQQRSASQNSQNNSGSRSGSSTGSRVGGGGAPSFQ